MNINVNPNSGMYDVTGNPGNSVGRVVISDEAASARSVDIANIKTGDVFSGQIVGFDEEGMVKIMLGEGSTVDAKLASGIPLNLGQMLSFQVKAAGNEIKLMPLFANLNGDSAVAKALNAAGIPVTKEAAEMVNSMMEHGMSVDSDSLNQMEREVSQFPFASPKSIVQMVKLGIPINETTVTQFEAYKAEQHKISEGVTSLATDFAEMAGESGTINKAALELFARPLPTQLALALKSSIEGDQTALNSILDEAEKGAKESQGKALGAVDEKFGIDDSTNLRTQNKGENLSQDPKIGQNINSAPTAKEVSIEGSSVKIVLSEEGEGVPQKAGLNGTRQENAAQNTLSGSPDFKTSIKDQTINEAPYNPDIAKSNPDLKEPAPLLTLKPAIEGSLSKEYEANPSNLDGKINPENFDKKAIVPEKGHNSAEANPIEASPDTETKSPDNPTNRDLFKGLSAIFSRDKAESGLITPENGLESQRGPITGLLRSIFAVEAPKETEARERVLSDLEKLMSPKDREVLSDLIKDAGVPERLVKLVKEGRISAEDTLSIIRETLNLKSQDAARDEELQGAITRLIASKPYKNLLKNGMMNEFLMKPEEFSDKEKVQEYYQKISNIAKESINLLNAVGRGDSALKSGMQDLKQNLDFMNQMNQAMTYIQLPLKMNEFARHGDLYVYTNKKNLAKRDGAISALLHLDMERLGTLDIHVSMVDRNKVTTHFILKDEALLDFVAAHLPELDQTLLKRGYKMSSDVALNREERSVADIMFNKGSNAKLIQQTSFDMRA
ncbi:MAG: flagellar hook-length control protein FliK [Lachnospiraceae bacterium]|nr:flagellar hook-length control protein FliK [Lachnospiraceae bacterium]